MEATCPAALEIQHVEDYFCLEDALDDQDIRLKVAMPMLINGFEITLDPNFSDYTKNQAKSIKIRDPVLVDTILKNQSDSIVAGACASYIENLCEYTCAETALKTHQLDGVDIEITSWVEKKKPKAPENPDVELVDSPLEVSGCAVEISDCLENVTPETDVSISEEENSIDPSHVDQDQTINRGSGHVYRCSRCPFTHSELKEVAAHQATSHLPQKSSESRSTNMSLQISKFDCTWCKNKHIAGRYSCKNCAFETMCPMELEKHMWCIHKSMHIYHCPCCTFVSQAYMQMEKHLVEKHAMEKPGEKSNTSTEKGKAKVELKKAPTSSKLKERNIKKPERNESVAQNLPLHFAAYHCALCAFSTNVKEEFEVHISKYHNKYTCLPFMCLLCGKEFFNKEGLTLHSKFTHDKQPQSFALNKTSQKSMLEETSEKIKAYADGKKDFLSATAETGPQWWCLVCGSGPQPYQYHLTPHIASHLVYKPYTCSICRSPFKLQLLANNHIKESVLCAKQNAMVKVNMYLKKLQMADIEILRKCVPSQSAMLARRPYESGDNLCPFSCQVCLHSAKTFSQLKDHMQLHLSIEPLECPAYGCSEKSPNISSYDAHVGVIHQITELNPLKVASNSKTILELYKESARLAHENGIHIPALIAKGGLNRVLERCPHCKLGPCGKAGLAVHMTFHSPQTPYTCLKCGLKFQQEILAQTHVVDAHGQGGSKISKNEKLAAVQGVWVSQSLGVHNHCNPEFTLKSEGSMNKGTVMASLTPKVKVVQPSKDVQKKVNKCLMCSLYCPSPAKLEKHVVEHLNFQPFECSICGETYKTDESCHNHIQRNHADTSTSMDLNFVKCHTTVNNAELKLQLSAMKLNTAHERLVPSRSKIKEDVPTQDSAKRETTKQNQPYSCRDCNKTMKSREDARKHFMCHHAQIKPYSCADCGFEGSIRDEVNEHWFKEHRNSESARKINSCAAKRKKLMRSLDRFLGKAKIFSNKDDPLLKGRNIVVPKTYRAIRITSSGRSCVYRCSKCSHTSRSMDAFKKHILEHLDLEQYRCAHCDYTNDKLIYRHIRSVHGSREEYDDVVETKPYIMLLSQMEDLAREVVLLDETFHEDSPVDTDLASTPQYICACLHCKKCFHGLMLARKHHADEHASKQFMVDIDLNFSGALAGMDESEEKGESDKVGVDENKQKRAAETARVDNDGDDNLDGESDDEEDNDEDDNGDDLFSDSDEQSSAVMKEVKSKLDSDSDDEPLAKKFKLSKTPLRPTEQGTCGNLASKTPEPASKAEDQSKETDAGSKGKDQLQSDDSDVLIVSPVKLDKDGTRATTETNTVTKDNNTSLKSLDTVPMNLPALLATYCKGSYPAKTTGDADSCRTLASKPGGQHVCHICQSSLVNLTSLKRHFLLKHTAIRPYSCNASNCTFISSEPYEIKRHSKHFHNGKSGMMTSEKHSRRAQKAMRIFLEDWRKASVHKISDTKLFSAVIELEDIAKNLTYAKYFKAKASVLA